MSLVNYGSNYPKPRQISSGWAIPLGIASSINEEGQVEYSALEVVAQTLFRHDIEAAIAVSDLPNSDYSSDIHAALCHGIRLQRSAEYPPAVDYLDGVVKGDQEQIDTYIAECIKVKEKYPFPEL